MSVDTNILIILKRMEQNIIFPHPQMMQIILMNHSSKKSAKLTYNSFYRKVSLTHVTRLINNLVVSRFSELFK